MKWLALIAGLWVLGGCAFAPPSPDATATPSRGSAAATIDLAISVADADTDEPIVVDAVWLDDAVAYRHVSGFVLMIPGDFPPSQDGHLIRITAAGYDTWVTHIRLRTRRDRSLTLPVHMHHALPHARRATTTDAGASAHARSETSPA